MFSLEQPRNLCDEGLLCSNGVLFAIIPWIPVWRRWERIIPCVQTQLGRRHSPGPLPPYVLERSGSLYTASRSSSQCEPLPENAILDTPPDHVSGGPMGSREVLLQVPSQQSSSYRSSSSALCSLPLTPLSRHNSGQAHRSNAVSCSAGLQLGVLAPQGPCMVQCACRQSPRDEGCRHHSSVAAPA